jgi:hypothetical protein
VEIRRTTEKKVDLFKENGIYFPAEELQNFKVIN